MQRYDDNYLSRITERAILRVKYLYPVSRGEQEAAIAAVISIANYANSLSSKIKELEKETYQPKT